LRSASSRAASSAASAGGQAGQRARHLARQLRGEVDEAVVDDALEGLGHQARRERPARVGRQERLGARRVEHLDQSERVEGVEAAGALVARVLTPVGDAEPQERLDRRAGRRLLEHRQQRRVERARVEERERVEEARRRRDDPVGCAVGEAVAGPRRPRAARPGEEPARQVEARRDGRRGDRPASEGVPTGVPGEERPEALLEPLPLEVGQLRRLEDPHLDEQRRLGAALVGGDLLRRDAAVGGERLDEAERRRRQEPYRVAREELDAPALLLAAEVEDAGRPGGPRLEEHPREDERPEGPRLPGRGRRGRQHRRQGAGGQGRLRRRRQPAGQAELRPGALLEGGVLRRRGQDGRQDDPVLPEPRAELEPRRVGQRVIDDERVRLARLRARVRLPGRRDGERRVAGGGQGGAERRPARGIIVHDQDAGRHGAVLVRGPGPEGKGIVRPGAWPGAAVRGACGRGADGRQTSGPGAETAWASPCRPPASARPPASRRPSPRGLRPPRPAAA
jgi:hypothetical protein